MISPEGCASILFKSADKAADAAEAMGITSQRLKGLDLIDRVIEEPLGGAHRDPEDTISRFKQVLQEELADLETTAPDNLIEMRYKRLQGFGQFRE